MLPCPLSNVSRVRVLAFRSSLHLYECEYVYVGCVSSLSVSFNTSTALKDIIFFECVFFCMWDEHRKKAYYIVLLPSWHQYEQRTFIAEISHTFCKRLFKYQITLMLLFEITSTHWHVVQNPIHIRHSFT